MAITGAVGAALRQDAPYQAEIQMGAQLIMDFQGARSGWRPYYWYRGTRYSDFRKIPGAVFSRASVAYGETLSGQLVRFPANEPVITDRGLATWEARANLALDAASPGLGAAWTSVVGGVPVAIPGPANDLAAVRWTDDTASSGHRPAQAGVSLVAGTTYTFSAYVRAGTRQHIRLTAAGTDQVTAVFDVFNKVALGTHVTAGGPTNVSSGIARLGASDWWRIWLTFTAAATGNVTALVGHALGGTPSTAADNYVGSAQYTDLFGFQVEVGTGASSFIPTTNVQATRAADTAYIGGLGGIFGPPFALAVRANLPAIDGASRDLVSLSAAGSGTNSVRISRGAANQVVATIATGGAAQPTSGFVGLTGEVSARVVERIRATEARMALNGVLAGSTAIAAPPGLDRIDLGRQWGGVNYLNGTLERVTAFGDVDDTQATRLSQ